MWNICEDKGLKISRTRIEYVERKFSENGNEDVMPD